MTLIPNRTFTFLPVISTLIFAQHRKNCTLWLNNIVVLLHSEKHKSTLAYDSMGTFHGNFDSKTNSPNDNNLVYIQTVYLCSVWLRKAVSDRYVWYANPPRKEAPNTAHKYNILCVWVVGYTHWIVNTATFQHFSSQKSVVALRIEVAFIRFTLT